MKTYNFVKINLKQYLKFLLKVRYHNYNYVDIQNLFDEFRDDFGNDNEEFFDKFCVTIIEQKYYNYISSTNGQSWLVKPTKKALKEIISDCEYLDETQVFYFSNGRKKYCELFNVNFN